MSDMVSVGGGGGDSTMIIVLVLLVGCCSFCSLGVWWAYDKGMLNDIIGNLGMKPVGDPEASGSDEQSPPDGSGDQPPPGGSGDDIPSGGGEKCTKKALGSDGSKYTKLVGKDNTLIGIKKNSKDECCRWCEATNECERFKYASSSKACTLYRAKKQSTTENKTPSAESNKVEVKSSNIVPAFLNKKAIEPSPIPETGFTGAYPVLNKIHLIEIYFGGVKRTPRALEAMFKAHHDLRGWSISITYEGWTRYYNRSMILGVVNQSWHMKKTAQGVFAVWPVGTEMPKTGWNIRVIT